MSAAAIALFGMSILSGCAGGDVGIKPPPLGKVRGTITLDGDPLADALVQFDPGTARGSSGMTDGEGVYKLSFDEKTEGAAVGEHKVRIMTKVAAGEGAERVPAKYNEKSELKATVEEGDNSLDFDLSSK